MSIRSTTGCYACKSRRKKCDETKPKCLRCTKSRIECEYEYILPTGKSTKKRTRPAPRPASEQAKKLEKQQSDSTATLSATNGTEASNPLAGLFDYPLVPSLDVSLPLDTDWEAALYSSAPMPSLDPLAIRAVLSPSIVSQQSVTLPSLTPNQASLFHALLSLGETNSPPQANSPRSDSLTHPPPHVDSNQCMPQRYGSNSYSIFDSHLDEYEEDNEDLEGVKVIFCETPLGLDRTTDSNSLPFVLQSFGQWLPLVVFDPLRIIHKAKRVVINQFSESPDMRSRLLLISELMRSLSKSWILDERGRGMLGLLGGDIWRNVTGYQVRTWPPSEEDRERANAALDHLLELTSIKIITSPLSDMLRILESAAPVFLAACPPPHPPDLANILLEAGINLRHFATIDVAVSVTTGRPLLCRYHVSWSLQLCDEFMKKKGDQGLQWLVGIPDQFILLFAYMKGLKEDAEAAGTSVDRTIISQIEEDVRQIVILPCEGKEPSLAIGRMVVQECWREAVFIYIYMALCGAHALDPRVERSQKAFMRLVNGIKPGRNPDTFLIIPMLIAGVATTKTTHRQIIRSRILALPECANPGTAGNDALLTLEDVWTRTESEGRVARWEDLREGCGRITGS